MNTSLCLALGQRCSSATGLSRGCRGVMQRNLYLCRLFIAVLTFTQGGKPPECAGAFDYDITSLFQEEGGNVALFNLCQYLVIFSKCWSTNL